MKRICAFILALFYLSFSVGATIHQHYCMGELAGISLFDKKDGECGTCGMEKHTTESKDCCKDVSLIVKTGDNHTFFAPVYDFHSVSPALPVTFYIANDAGFSNNLAKTFSLAHSPPTLQSPLYIRFSNFRI